MADSKKRNFKKAQFLTSTQFATKYGFLGKENRELVHDAFRALYKKGIQVKNEINNFDSVIFSDRSVHSETSRYKAHPLHHDVIFTEIEKQKKIKAQRG